MKVSSLDDEGRLVCDECVKLSESVSMNAKFSYGYNSEIVWSRTAEEDSATGDIIVPFSTVLYNMCTSFGQSTIFNCTNTLESWKSFEVKLTRVTNHQ